MMTIIGNGLTQAQVDPWHPMQAKVFFPGCGYLHALQDSQNTAACEPRQKGHRASRRSVYFASKIFSFLS
jgi:hypothetical protein